MKRVVLFLILIISAMAGKTQQFDATVYKTISGYYTPIGDVKFSPKGNYFALSMADNTIDLYDKNFNRIWHHRANSDYGAGKISFSADEKYMAFTKYKSKADAAILRLSDKAVIKILSENVNSVSFSPNGKFLAYVYPYSILYSVPDKFSMIDKYYMPANSVTFSPDGKFLAATFYKFVDIYSVSEGRSIKSFYVNYVGVLSASFSPDNSFLAVVSKDNTVSIFSIPDGFSLIKTLYHRGDVNSVSFSPDGKFLATASDDNTVKIYSVSDGFSLIKTLYHRGDVNSVSFSPDGKYLATAGDDKCVIYKLHGVGDAYLALAEYKCNLEKDLLKLGELPFYITNFYVTVKNKKGKPLKNVQISYNEGILLGTTDENGKFEGLNSSGHIKLTFQKGNKIFTKTMNFSKDSIYYFDLTLSKPESTQLSIKTKSIEPLIYEKIKYSDDIGLFNAFLKHFPNSKYKEEVLSKIETLWYYATINSDCPSLYKTFIGKYPNSKYIERIKIKYDSLLFAIAKQTNTLYAYKDYLNISPLKLHKHEAEKSAYQLVEAINREEDYYEYIKLFPSSDYAESAKLKIEDINYQMAKNGDIDACENYLTKYPNGRYVKQIYDRIKYLIFRQAEQGTLADCEKYIKIFNRINLNTNIKDTANIKELADHCIKNINSLDDISKYMKLFSSYYDKNLLSNIALDFINSFNDVKTFLSIFPEQKQNNDLINIAYDKAKYFSDYIDFAKMFPSHANLVKEKAFNLISNYDMMVSYINTFNENPNIVIPAVYKKFSNQDLYKLIVNYPSVPNIFKIKKTYLLNSSDKISVLNEFPELNKDTKTIKYLNDNFNYYLNQLKTVCPYTNKDLEDYAQQARSYAISYSQIDQINSVLNNRSFRVSIGRSEKAPISGYQIPFKLIRGDGKECPGVIMYKYRNFYEHYEISVIYFDGSAIGYNSNTYIYDPNTKSLSPTSYYPNSLSEALNTIVKLENWTWRCCK